IVVTDGSQVSEGTQIGTVGRTPRDRREGCTPPDAAHLHFEVKDHNVLGDMSDDGPNWGYTPDHPDQHGYHDPLVSLHTVSDFDSPFRVRISEDRVNLRVGPGGNGDTAYRVINELSAGEEYNAFRSQEAAVLGCSRGWYQIRRLDGGRFIDVYGGEMPAGWVCANLVARVN